MANAKLKDSEVNPFFSRLADHYGHRVEIAAYGGHGMDAENLAVECIDCHEVITDANREPEEGEDTGEGG